MLCSHYSYRSNDEEYPEKGLVALVVVNRFSEEIDEAINKQMSLEDMIRLCCKRMETVINMVPV